MSFPVVSASQLEDESFRMPVKESSCLWNGAIFSLHEDFVQLPDATELVKREYISHPGAVAVVPLRICDGRPQVLLIRQYRHPVRAYLWEFPAGLLDIAGEDYLVAAQRELAEEADLQAKEWDVLLDYFATPGGHNESLRIYLARDVQEIPRSGISYHRYDEEALFDWAWVDLEELVTAIVAGKLHNPALISGTLVTYYAYKNDWQTLRPVDSPWMR